MDEITKKIILMTKKTTILGAALATVLLSSCATTDPNQEPGVESRGTPSLSVTPQSTTSPAKTPLMVENQQGSNGVNISMEPGPQGGLRIPQQLIVPEVKPKKEGDRTVEAPGHEP